MFKLSKQENLLKVGFVNSKRFKKSFLLFFLSLILSLFYINISLFTCLKNENNLGICQIEEIKLIGSFKKDLALKNIHSAFLKPIHHSSKGGSYNTYKLTLSTYDGELPLFTREDTDGTEFTRHIETINAFIHNKNIKSINIVIQNNQWWMPLAVALWIAGIIILLHSKDHYCIINKDFNAFIFVEKSLLKRTIKEFKISELTDIEIEEEKRYNENSFYYVHRICFIFFQHRYQYPFKKFKQDIQDDLYNIKDEIIDFIRNYNPSSLSEDTPKEQ